MDAGSAPGTRRGTLIAQPSSSFRLMRHDMAIIAEVVETVRDLH
jgi:hypothetical protein